MIRLANSNKYVIYTVNPFKIIKPFSCSISIIEYSNFDNLDSFPLIIDDQKPIILDFILICIGCLPNSACNIYRGTFSQVNNLSKEIIM